MIYIQLDKVDKRYVGKKKTHQSSHQVRTIIHRVREYVRNKDLSHEEVQRLFLINKLVKENDWTSFTFDKKQKLLMKLERYPKIFDFIISSLRICLEENLDSEVMRKLGEKYKMFKFSNIMRRKFMKEISKKVKNFPTDNETSRTIVLNNVSKIFSMETGNFVFVGVKIHIDKQFNISLSKILS